MVDAQEFKQHIRAMLTQQHRVEFLGENFDKIASALSESKASKIYVWIEEVIRRDAQPITINSSKRYKEWPAKELLVFRYPFTESGNQHSILLVKVRNSFYIEFHLGDHKYYDRITQTRHSERIPALKGEVLRSS
jgi:hypothetical protein